ncbi:M20 metallopeptidase family protein [Tissierellaceae bacterium HCP3S3_D8]
MKNYIDSINEAKDVSNYIIDIRRKLHKIPELDDDLYETSKIVKKELDSMGIPYKTVAKTGIVGVIEGELDGGTIGIRADMDALPIKEETGLPFASTNGAMHACGHDAHTAILLGTAKVLSENRNKIRGNVKLLFQPAEESFGGADTMIKEGALEDPKVDRIIGLHVGSIMEGSEEGKIAMKSGTLMAAVDIFKVKIVGKGAHAASPHLSVDPILIASEITISLQKIVSREINPLNPAVVTVAQIKGGSASNIIPEYAEIVGTVRTTDKDDRIFIQERIQNICKYVCKANNAEATIEYLNHFPMLVNDIEFTEGCMDVIGDLFGKEEVVELKNVTLGAEDMSYFLQEAKGTYFMLGTNNKDKGIVYPAHHPKFNLDEDVLWKGAAAFLEIINRWQDK